MKKLIFILILFTASPVFEPEPIGLPEAIKALQVVSGVR